MVTIILVFAALVAGVWTTITGFGGSIILLLTVTAFWDARSALAISALAIFASNVHRMWLYRHNIDKKMCALVLAGVIPGALVGARLTTMIPEQAIHGFIIAMVFLSLMRSWLAKSWKLGPRGLVAASGVVGLTCGTGGGGFLVGPLVLATGIEGRRYLAVVAVAVTGMQVSRIVGYSSGGLMTTAVLRAAPMLAISLMIGNMIGNAMRDSIPQLWQRRLITATPAVCIALALAGL